MADTDVFGLQSSDLNSFLFAEVGVEASGMPLSVLSAIARLGMDPWQEAQRLAKLPRTAAVDVLARMIAAMPASKWPLPDAMAIAGKLVALLPGRSSSPPAVPSAEPEAAETWRRLRWAVVFAFLGMVFAGLMLNHLKPATETLGTDPAASLSTTPPANDVPTGD